MPTAGKLRNLEKAGKNSFPRSHYRDYTVVVGLSILHRLPSAIAPIASGF
ncbi:MAG: hypothetical protein V7K53_31430 [Nostoc sp.]